MPTLLHTFLLTLAVGAAYWWVSVPELTMYSLQALAWVALLYFLLKRVAKAKYWHVLPTALSIETALATFGFLLLIGSTGNTSSILFPLSYIHLFFIVFSSSVATSIVITLEVVLFHYALTPNLAGESLVTLLTLPLVLIFFLFAKRQHEELVRDRMIIIEENSELTELHQGDNQATTLLEALQAKVGLISQLAHFPQENQLSMQNQLTLIQLEMEKLQQFLKKRWFMWSSPEQQSPLRPYDKTTL